MNKRERILDAAKEIFFKKSFYEATMEDIAEISGIKKSTIYYYFPSKTDLVLELIRESMEKIFSQLEKILKTQEDPKEKVREIVKFYADIYEESFKPFIVLQRLGYDFMYAKEEKSKIENFLREFHFKKKKIGKLFGDVVLSTGKRVNGEIFSGALIGALGKMIFEYVSQNRTIEAKYFMEIGEIFIAALS